MRTAFLHPQPWSAPKRSSSQTLPAILDDDEESGSTTCEVPDSSSPGVIEALSSSGDERWSIGNEMERGGDSGDQGFLEVGSVSPAGLYSPLRLLGGIAALPFDTATFATGHYNLTAPKRSLSAEQLADEDRDCDSLPTRPGTEPQQRTRASRERQQQQQQRAIPALPSNVGSSRPLQAKRGPPPRLVALVTDVAREAAASAAAAQDGMGEPSDRRTTFANAALAPMPTWPPASPGPTSPLQYDARQAPLVSPTAQTATATPAGMQPPPALQRERTRSLGRSRSVGMSGTPLMPTGSRPPLSPRGVDGGGGAAAGSASAAETTFTTRASASSILEPGGGGGGGAPTAPTGLRPSLSHSAPPHLQQRQPPPPPLPQPAATAPVQLQQPQPPGPSLGPFTATRLRTTSQAQLRVGSQPSHGLPPAPPVTSPDGSQHRPLLQLHTPWWGLPPPALGSGGGAATRLGAVGAPTGGGGAAAAAGPPPQVPSARASSSPDHPQYSMGGLSPRTGGAAAAECVVSVRAWQQRQASPPLSPTPISQPRAMLSPPLPTPPLLSSQSQQLLLQRGLQDSDQQHASDFPRHQHKHIHNASSAPLLQVQETTQTATAQSSAAIAAAATAEPSRPKAISRAPAAAAATAAAPPPLPSAAPSAAGGQGPVPPPRVIPVGPSRTARQSAPSLGRFLQLPDLHPSVGGGAAAATAAGSAGAAAGGAAPGESHVSGVGILAAGVGGPAAAEVPAAPEVVLRPPRWLKPSAFQVTEQLRSGRLQELVDKLATVTCPTFFDLGGLEFSGPFTPTDSTAAGTVSEPGAAAAAAAAAVTVLGAVMAGAPRHQTLRASIRGIGVIRERNRYMRSTPAGSGGGTVGGCGSMQVLTIPPGQHITLYNATLMLTADQYILVGPGASLTLKGVEVLGCSREAARQSAAVRRRALSVAAAAAAASASPAAQTAIASAAIAAVTSTAASGYSKMVRRTSSPGRTTRDSGVYGGGGGGRRSSVTDGILDGSSGNGGTGLPPVRRRAITTTGTPPSVLPISLQGGQNTTGFAVQELVDPNEYIEEHGLIEVVGGYARVSNCRLWPGRVQMALCVSDGGGCSLSYSTAGACCAAGPRSCLVSEQTTYDGGAAGCVSALHGARLGLTDCVLRYPDGMPKAALAAEAAGAATGNGCNLPLGIEARGSGTLAVLTDCDVTNGGVGAALAARLYLQSIRVSDARGHGLLACDPGTALYVRDCRVDDSGGSAAVATNGAAVRVADSTLAGSSAAGVVVLPYDAAPPPAAAAAAAPPPPPRSTLTLLRCDVSANAGHGAAISGGGFLAVAESVLYNNLGSGVSVEGGGSVLSAVGMRLIRNEGHGVRATGGAGAVLARCCAMGNGRDGISMEGTGSRGHLTRCESRENRESGLCVTGSASVELSNTRLAANQHDGLAVGGDGSLAVAHGCVLNGNVAKGAVVCMGGAAELTECAVHCNGSKSVQVSDDDSRLVLGRACSLDRQPVSTSGGMLMQR